MFEKFDRSIENLNENMPTIKAYNRNIARKEELKLENSNRIKHII